MWVHKQKEVQKAKYQIHRPTKELKLQVFMAARGQRSKVTKGMHMSKYSMREVGGRYGDKESDETSLIII